MDPVLRDMASARARYGLRARQKSGRDKCFGWIELRFCWRRGTRLCRLAPIPSRHGTPMELRHLRYFIAVAEEGSLTLAAEKRLHTAQPSLSRQIRDLEYEVGVQLISRSVHGIELTAAGRAFLDHARLALTQ